MPYGTPAPKSWHVKRQGVMNKVIEGLTRKGGPRLVGLVGVSGSGKTTAAAEIVRTTEVREFFADGIVWLRVNDRAVSRLPSLMQEVAKTVHERLGGFTGSAPDPSDDGAVYVNEWLNMGHGAQGSRCLLVADNVWEEQVVTKLRETGMCVLCTARSEKLVGAGNGETINVDLLSDEDAESILLGASELPAGVRLPDAGRDLINLCGRVAMHLAFVGRWGGVYQREDPKAWSDTAVKIRKALTVAGCNATNSSVEDAQVKRRTAVLHAGFQDLSAEGVNVQWLYLALAVIPDSFVFYVEAASVLLFDGSSSAEDQAAAKEVLATLERWTIVTKMFSFWLGKRRMLC